MLRRSIKQFSQHPVASNLLMVLMMLSGVFAIWRLNVQFLPHFDVNMVRISVIWTGANSHDVMNSIIKPIEQELKDLDGVKKINSVASLGQASIIIEFNQHVNMITATQDVHDRVERVRNLPQDARDPYITQVQTYETIAKLLVSGPKRVEELRKVVHQFESELLESGINKIDILGLPDQEIRIEIPSRTLANLRLNLSDIGDLIRQQSADTPAGVIGRRDSAKQIRTEQQARTIEAFKRIPAISKPHGEIIQLGDITSSIQISPIESEPLVYVDGKPAVEMRLLRSRYMNAFKAAKIIHAWLDKTQAHYGKSLTLKLYDEKWQLIKGRLMLLLKNGAGGLILIVGILYLFLNRKVAFWVVMGIPASLMAALLALYFAGGSIDMVSMFAVIMTLGIIVDDTIVVGEQALTNLIAFPHQPPIKNIYLAAFKMLPPILSSSLTTVAAFLPLFFITGVIGSVLFFIPLVVVCVIFASVIECFYVLPGHLYHSFKHGYQDIRLDKIQTQVNDAFIKFRDHYYSRWVLLAIENRILTFTAVTSLFLLSVSLIAFHYLHFNFFPSPEGRLIVADTRFVIGTPQKTLYQFSRDLDKALQETVTSLKAPNLVVNAVSYIKHQGIDDRRQEDGEHVASYIIELINPELRNITNNQFITAWRQHIQLPAGIDSFAITSPRGGPPGKDIDIQLSGHDIHALKEASLQIKTKLLSFPGISGITDDVPYGQEQWLLSVKPAGLQAGITTRHIAKQLNAAFTGELVQIYHTDYDEVEVRVMLPASERSHLNQLDDLLIRNDLGQLFPFHTVGQMTPQAAPEIMKRTDGKLSIHVTAEVDDSVSNANQVLASLQSHFVPELVKQLNIQVSFRGKAEEQADAFHDMKFGLILGLTLIYIILAWVFESYLWPLVVMSAIPLGLTGAILGHLLMRLDLTILSLFGLFGLSGIVINDSIILINEYRMLKHTGLPIKKSIVQAGKNRLRAVLLTSMTTVAGLTPLLFERSLQAQFLIPMATSISFGLVYATVVILLFIPALLYTVEKARHKV